MALDLEQVKTTMPVVVPMVGTLGIAFDELTLDRAVLSLPDQKEYHNHVGGPHAGAMFTLAETASGALVFGNFGGVMDRATPLAVTATIRYLKLALGAVTAEAVLGRPAAEVIADLDAGKRPEFDVEVTIRDAVGATTGVMAITWTLKPIRRPAA